MNPLRGTDWGDLLHGELPKGYWAGLRRQIDGVGACLPVYPPAHARFRAFELTPCSETKVVIVGQDPYHGAGQAHGLCFSVPRGVKRPPSLVNIHRELHKDRGLPIPDHGSLEAWAHRGVLLLNATLTVCEGRAGSHERVGWGMFTDKVIQLVAEERDPVFLLWGKKAQRKKRLLKDLPRYVIEAAHPSPLSAGKGFFGSRPFSKANVALAVSGRNEIDWDLAD